MALTYTDKIVTQLAERRAVFALAQPDDDYPSGGYELDPQDFGLTKIDIVLTCGVYENNSTVGGAVWVDLESVPGTAKILFFNHDAASEAAGSTNLSGLRPITILVIGD